MSPKLNVLSGKKTIRVLNVLKKAGFYVERIKGSHHILVNIDDESHTVIIPVHANKDLKICTLRATIRQAGLTVEEFQDLVKTS